MIGLTNWQRNRTWQIVCREENKDKYRSYVEAITFTVLGPETDAMVVMAMPRFEPCGRLFFDRSW